VLPAEAGCASPSGGGREGDIAMIEVHRLNGERFLLNSDMIETINVTPDTVVRLLNGHRYIVREGIDEVCEKIVAFRRLAGYACIVANSADEAEDSEGAGS